MVDAAKRPYVDPILVLSLNIFKSFMEVDDIDDYAYFIDTIISYCSMRWRAVRGTWRQAYIACQANVPSSRRHNVMRTHRQEDVKLAPVTRTDRQGNVSMPNLT